MAWLIHSAKGSSWKHPMYVKKEGTPGKLEEDGKYYYPDSYKGGRHLPKNGKDNRATGEKKYKNDYPDDMEEWEKKVHDHLSGIIEKHPDLFKTGTDVAKGIMDPNNFQAVKNTLKAFGLPVDKMSDDDIKKLRRKIADAYDDKYQPEEPKTSSKKKKKKAKSTTEDNKAEEKSSDSKKKSGPSETSRVTMAGNEASKRSKEGMTKKDNEKITHSGFYISHSAKGTTWKRHKYVTKVNGRYIYKSDDLREKADVTLGRALATPTRGQKNPIEWDKNTDTNYYDNLVDKTYRLTRKASILRTKANEAESKERAHRLEAIADLTLSNLELKTKRFSNKAKKFLSKLFKK